MSRGDELRRAAVRGGDDERHVYADWLEQQGDALLARMIHCQCEQAAAGAWERARIELAWESAALIAELGDRWRADLPALDGVEWLEPERGFASTVRVRDMAALYDNAKAIAAAAPVYRVEARDLAKAELPGDVPWARVLRIACDVSRSSDPLVKQVDEIEFGHGLLMHLGWLVRPKDAPLRRLAVRANGDLGRALVESFAGKAWAKSLAHLELASTFVSDDSGYGGDPRLGAPGATALGKLEALETLVVDGQRIGSSLGKLVGALPNLRTLSVRDNGCKAITGLGTVKGTELESLDLAGNAIGRKGIQVLIDAPRLAKLRRLVLDTCEIESLGVEELVRSPVWQELRVLDLSRNPIGVSGVRAIASAAPPRHLHTLLLADVDLDDEAGGVLAKTPWIGALTALDLAGNKLGRGALALRDLPAERLRMLLLGANRIERSEASLLSRLWPQLVHLDMSMNPFGDAGLERFATTKEAKTLQTLGLRECKLGDDGLELLGRARMPRLRVLDLGANDFTGAALASLLRAPSMQHLESLDLTACANLAKALDALAATPAPPRLRHMMLRGCDFTEPELLALAASPGLRGVRIELDGNPYAFPSHPQLTARFGTSWNRLYDDPIRTLAQRQLGLLTASRPRSPG